MALTVFVSGEAAGGVGGISFGWTWDTVLDMIFHRKGSLFGMGKYIYYHTQSPSDFGFDMSV